MSVVRILVLSLVCTPVVTLPAQSARGLTDVSSALEAARIGMSHAQAELARVDARLGRQRSTMAALAYAEASGALAPRVGLLSIGEEEGKGNALVQEAYPLLRAALGERFYGNVEGRDIFLGTTEVVVTDGFTGNVALKLAEGEARVLLTWIKEALTSSFRARLGALLVREALARVKARVDPAQYGAMPLLGVEGAVFIGHGSADALAVKNALLRAKAMVEAGLLARVRQRLSALHV